MSPLKITVEDTPNPHAMKFMVNRPLGGDRPRSYAGPQAAADDPLASRLFGLRHVCNIMIVGNFCTVNKAPAGRWKPLIPQIEAVITEHLAGTEQP